MTPVKELSVESDISSPIKIDLNYNEKKSQSEFNSFYLVFPAIFYQLSCVLQNIALSKINSSTFMLLKSSLMIFTAGLSRIFLKKQLFAHHWASMITVVTGLTIVSYISTKYNEDKNQELDALPTTTRMHLWYTFLVLTS